MAYLDAASSQPLHPAARDAMLAAYERGFADPRRLHHEARSARLLLDNARAVVAECLGLRPDEVSFTGSGTEAVHRGVLGLLEGARRQQNAGPVRLAASAVEHSAVLHAGAWHADRGGELSLVSVDGLGRVDPDEVARASADVVAIQTANHEVGTIQPVAACAEAGVPLFTDACASIGRLPLPQGWAAAAGSAHKFGGPAGVGLMLVRAGARWRNAFPVDDRVDPRVAGFEHVPAALGAAAALRAVLDESTAANIRSAAQIDRVRAAASAIPDTDLVGDPVDRLPHLVTFSCLYLDGETLVGELERRGLSVTSGSACTASTLEPSHVLVAMGALTHGNVRVSVTPDTADEDVDRLCAVLPEVVARLREQAGVT